MSKINIRPSTGVYATYKNIRYDPWTAIAEFVDNSTQSYYDHKKELQKAAGWAGLEVEIRYEEEPGRGQTLTIIDNAYGMNFDDFKRAIILDSPPKTATRSEFGMGLKTAACWFGVNWSVETVEFGSGRKFKTSVDVDALHKTKNEEIEVEESSCSRNAHGTVIKIWNLNRRIMGRQIKKTKDQLSGMYRVDLRTGEIRISYNGESLTFDSPDCFREELSNKKEKIWKKEIKFTLEQDGKRYPVSGFVGILETASLSGAGFTLIRRGRVIIGGYENGYRPEEIFGKSNTFRYQRVFGELNMDNWPVTQTKDAFDWYNGLEDKLIEELKKQCKEYCDKAETIRKRAKVQAEASIDEMVNDFVRTGVIKNAVSKPLPKSEQRPDNPKNDVIDPMEDGLAAAIEVTGNQGKRIAFQHNGVRYTVDFVFRYDADDLNWLSVSQKGNGVFSVGWNIRHPFFRPYIDEPKFLQLLQRFTFAMVLSELEAKKTAVDGKVDANAIRMKMNETLKSVVG